MKIIALDLGSSRTGFACGVAGGHIRVEAWLLRRRGDAVRQAARNLGRTLRDNIQFENPDLIAVEDFLNPEAIKSPDAVIASLLMHGAVESIAGLWGIPVMSTAPGTIRKHFCGKASALPRSAGPKTSRQKAEAREATKQMVLKRAITLRYLPRDCVDYDKADACAIFDHAAHARAGHVRKELVLFGEDAA
ncbi:MAG: hypothetical protein Q8M31_21800 [Beijerinckiaceae bacterium]|nr:hypothetical protein [Beijerinckiaceae bacterium]